MQVQTVTGTFAELKAMSLKVSEYGLFQLTLKLFLAFNFISGVFNFFLSFLSNLDWISKFVVFFNVFQIKSKIFFLF